MRTNLSTFPKTEMGYYDYSNHIAIACWFTDLYDELEKELEICDLGIEFCEKCQKNKEILGI